MMKREARTVSRSTGEEIPDWLAPDDDTVVEGVGDVIVREETDGTWSVVRSVDGAEPEVDNGYASEEVAMRLAKAYHEGGRVIVERRVSKQVKVAGVRKGMVAKYGESPVVIIDISGNDAQVMSPDGTTKYVDITQLSDVRMAQEPGTETPFFGDVPFAESPAGMMAGEEENEEGAEEEVLPEGVALTEEEMALLEQIEEEDDLSGAMIGPPVYFVEIEPLPGQRQSPLGASKTAAVYMSQEKGERPDLRIKPSEMIDLYASIGIPLTKTAEKVKIGEVFLVFDSDTYRLEEELVNGRVTPATADMSEAEAVAVMQSHTDFPPAAIAAAIEGAVENGSVSLGDRLGFLVRAEITLEQTPEGTGLVIMDDGIQVTDPMDESQARMTLLESTSLTEDSIIKAVDYATQGHTPIIGPPDEEEIGMGPEVSMPAVGSTKQGGRVVIANVKIAKEAPVCKKCNQRHWPFHPCSGTKPEKEKPQENPEEKAEEKKETDAEKSAGRVRMQFDWNEFFEDVVPQLSNSQFQKAFAEAASSPPETTAPQEELDLHDQELLLFQREATRRKLPDISKLRFGIGDIVVLADDSDIQGQVIEYRGTDDDISFLLDLPTGHQVWVRNADHQVWVKRAEAKPTSNPDTTTVPWTERTKRIVDPENKKQDSAFQKDLKQTTGQADGEGPSDAEIEDAAINAVAQAIPRDMITTVAEEMAPDADPFDAAYNLVQEQKAELIAAVSEVLPGIQENPELEDMFLHYARNVVTWDLPRSQEAPQSEVPGIWGMKRGYLARIKADYETDNTELQQLRDLGIAGTIVDLNGDDAAIAFGNDVLLISQGGLEVMASGFFRECTIRKCTPGDRDPDKPADAQVWCLYAKSTGKVLGRHPNRDDAIDQEKAIKAQGGFRTAEDELCPEFVQESLAKEKKAVEECEKMIHELSADSSERKALEKIRDEKKAHVATFEKWQRDNVRLCATEVPLRREAPGLPGGYPGTTGEPSPKNRGQVSAPPGAPSRGREKETPPGPPEVCICTISGKEIPKQAGVPCSSMENPEHPGVKLIAKPTGPPPSPGKKPSAATLALRQTAENVKSYADCLVARVQRGVITTADAIKELGVEAKQWDWTAAQKKYVKQRLEGKELAPPEEWALASKRPFDRGRAPAQDALSGGGVKARDIHVAQSDIATLLKELERGDAQGIIRSLDAPIDVSNALEGLGWGDDTSDLRQWLIDAPGMTEDILRMYAGDPESSNRLVALRAMADRFPQADVSAWLEDAFPFIAERAQELASGVPAEEALPPPVPSPAWIGPEAPVSTGVKTVTPPGGVSIAFPESPDPPEDAEEKTPRKKAARVPTQLMLTYDEPNGQYVLYDVDFGLVSPGGAQEKQIRGQLQAFGVDSDRINEALKDSKDSIVLVHIASTHNAELDVRQLAADAVQTAIVQLSPEAPRATLMMLAMEEFAKVSSPDDARVYQEQLKNALNLELEQHPRPEIPGTHQEFTQIAETDSNAKTGRTYDDQEKKQRVKDLAKHGIPLEVTFEKKPPPEDIPPGRRLSTATIARTGESRFGFAVGDSVRDQAMQDLTGIVSGFGAGNTIKVAMDVSTYCPQGGIGLYLPEGLINLGSR